MNRLLPFGRRCRMRQLPSYCMVRGTWRKNNISPEYPEKVNDLSLPLKKWLISCQESNSGSDYQNNIFDLNNIP
jgi:hypothetical protein